MFIFFLALSSVLLYIHEIFRLLWIRITLIFVGDTLSIILLMTKYVILFNNMISLCLIIMGNWSKFDTKLFSYWFTFVSSRHITKFSVAFWQLAMYILKIYLCSYGMWVRFYVQMGWAFIKCVIAGNYHIVTWSWMSQ